MAKEKEKNKDLDEELTLEQAQAVIRRLGNPERKIKELELLKQASVVVAKETQPEFEFDEGEEGDVDIGLSSDETVTSELTKAPGFLEHASAQVASLGTAGVMAIASATYFQVDTVVEQTREVAAVAEQKWEEFEEEHPNFNWDDPFEAFTTVVGIGELDIDIDPTTGTAIPSTEPKEPNEPTTVSTGAEPSGEETPTEEASEESAETSEESDSKDKDSNEKAVEEEKAKEESEEEEPKKKKKKGLFSFFGGDDEEEEEEESEEEEQEEPTEEKEEESAEESEEPAEEESEEVTEEAEAEEESSEPEPEAEEEPAQEEKPKKKSGGFLSGLFGGGDKESEEPDEEQGEEPTQDDTIPDEQAEEESATEPEAETTDGEVAGGESEAKPSEGTNVAESNGVKKSSGGGLLSFFTGNKEEVVEDSEVSAESEEPEILVADSEQAPEPPTEEPQVEVESIDSMDDIKPHSMVGDEAFVETEVEVEVDDVEMEVEVEVEVAEIEMDVDISIEDILEMSEVAIEDVQIADVGGDDIIENIEKVLTPIDDAMVVSPVTTRPTRTMMASNN